MEHQLKYNCPCCGLPTLFALGCYGICPVCWWEDDGQNDENADEVFGAPNHGYSLTKARSNYRKHGHMYDFGNGLKVVEQPTADRVALVEYAKSVQSGNMPFCDVRFQQLIDAEKCSRIE